MKINPQTWHYWLYKTSYRNDYRVPAQTSLCQYMRRIIVTLMVSPGVLVGAIIYGIAYVLAMPAALVLGLIHGLKPYGWTGVFKYSYNNYTPLYVGSGRDIYPAHIVTPALLLFLVHHFWAYLMNEPGGYALLLMVTILCALATAISYGVAEVPLDAESPGAKKARGTQEPKEDSLLVAYIKAKKSSICPIVTFETPE
jgi:hypothetical protein